jgi:hypothetical protein
LATSTTLDCAAKQIANADHGPAATVAAAVPHGRSMFLPVSALGDNQPSETLPYSIHLVHK